MFIIGYVKEGQKVYLRRNRYTDPTPDYNKARVFTNIGHVKNWAKQKPSYAKGYFMQELKFELGEEVPMEDIYK